MAIEPSDVTTIIDGIFQINARLGDLTEDVRAIRRLIEEDDDGEEPEDG